jgi:hypothetical protein
MTPDDRTRAGRFLDLLKIAVARDEVGSLEEALAVAGEALRFEEREGLQAALALEPTRREDLQAVLGVLDDAVAKLKAEPPPDVVIAPPWIGVGGGD